MTPESVRCWTMDEIGTLSERSFRAPIDWAGREFTLTVWFRPDRLTGKQVVVRLNRPEEIGWTLALDDGRLAAEFGTGEDIISRADGPPVPSGRWTFAALIADAGLRSFRVTDGQHLAKARLDAQSHGPSLREIIVGGFTDPAGGHYDHTFGRNGSGLADAVCLFDHALSDDELAARSQVTGESPAVQLVWDVERKSVPCDVHFQAVHAHSVRSFVWDFGDGMGGVGRDVTHRFAWAGDYTVRLVAIGDGHLEAVADAVVSLSGPADTLRRIPVFSNGSEGYACYRIPSIVCVANGDLLALAEGRRDSCSDSTPVIHIVSKRSRDNGETWEPLEIVACHDAGALMNASPVVDTARGTGRVVLLYNRMTANEWALSRGEGRNQTFCLVSDDSGETWSVPRDISEQIGSVNWRIQRPALGHAVQRADGRIIHASTITQGASTVFDSRNVLIWSDDRGESWHRAEPCPIVGLNEASAVVLDDDGVLINSRAYIGGKPAGRRALTMARFTPDDDVVYGETIYDSALVDSAVQASTLRVGTRHGTAVLFANPAHPEARRRLTIRASFDGCATWPVAREVDGGPSSYSDMVLQVDGYVGVLYERGNQGGIVYVRCALDWLLEDPKPEVDAVEQGGVT